MIVLRIKYLVGLSTLLLLISGCRIIYHKSELHLINEEFNKKNVNFRTDGIYYLIKDFDKNTVLVTSPGTSDRTDRNFRPNYTQRAVGVKPLVFYNNGYVYKSEATYGTFVYSTQEEKRRIIEKAISDIEERIYKKSFHYKIENSIWNWGLYKQVNDSILVQSYVNILGDYHLIDWEGKVINDTTIVLAKKETYEIPYIYQGKPNSKFEEIKEIYIFRKLSIKPDSVNYIMTHRHRFGEKKHNKQ